MILGKAYRYSTLGIANLFTPILRLLPDRTLLKMRGDIAVVKKMDYPRCDILLCVDSEIENDIRTRSSSKEPETIAWIETDFRPGDVFYDVGANVGAYSMVASKYFNGNLKVCAFEPGFVTFAQLCRNIRLNNCQDCITPLQVALSDFTRIDFLNYSNLIAGGALHTLGSSVDGLNPVFRQAVLSFRMDDLIQYFSMPTPNHIKIDVDGNELSVVQGAEKTLANRSLRSMLIELQEGSQATEHILEYLAGKGLEVRSKHEFQDPSGKFPNMFNYIFVKRPG